MADDLDRAVTLLESIQNDPDWVRPDIAIVLALLWTLIAQNPNLKPKAVKAAAALAPHLHAAPSSLLAKQPYMNGAYGAAFCANDPILIEIISRARFPQDQWRAPVVISATAGLEEWCRLNGHACHVIDALIDVTLPRSSPYSDDAAYTTQPTRWASIPGGYYLSGWDLVVTPDRTVLVDTGHILAGKWYPAINVHYAPQLEKIAHYWPATIESVDEDVLIISSGYLFNFGHWLIGILPRMRLREHVGRSFKLAVPDDLTAKEFETLQYFGIGENDIVRCRNETCYRFRTVYAATFGNGAPPNPRSVSFVRDHLYQPKNPARPQRSPKRIFIDRGRVGQRSIYNAEDVSAVMREEDFFVVELSGMSWTEQRELFAEVEVVMGVYGSNLYAIYLCPPGCTVIALWPPTPSRVDPDIASICGMLQLKHQYFKHCTFAPEQEFHKDKEVFIVDCGELRKRLRELN